MKIKFLIAICTMCTVFCFAQNKEHISVEIDKYIEHLIDRQGIPGVALAVIKDDKIIHQKNYGYANLEHQVPVTDQSIFRLYSLTKPIIAVGIFQLIENGKISLDDTVSKYVADLPESWQSIQIKHLLTHSSGLPDMRPLANYQDITEVEARAKVITQKQEFEAGETYDYNQTGFWLLQKVIEKVENVELSDYIINQQFELPTDTAFFSVDSRDIIQNRATPYFYFQTGSIMIDHPYLQGTYSNTMCGLNMTLHELIKWNDRFHHDKLITAASKKAMWQTFDYQNSDKIFTYGWDKHLVNDHISYGFSGGLVTAYRIFPADNLSIIFLSNGLAHYFNIENIVNHIASIVDEDIVDVNNLFFETLLQASVKNDIANFKKEYQKIKTKPNAQKTNFENQLNDLGYFWLFGFHNTEKAIEIFDFNRLENPTSWNTYDSLAEAYEHNGNKEKAITFYTKALNLNTQNNNNYNSKLKAKIEELGK